MTASAFYEGTVAHRRFAVREHAFRYRISMAYLDLDEVPALRIGAGASAAATTSATPGRPLREAVRELAGPGAPRGPVRVLTNLRTLGHCFNPVCFYYLFEEDGETLGAVVAEVTNTPWGDRHAYVLRREDGGRVLAGRHGQADARVAVHGHGPALRRCAPPSPGPTLSVHIENREDGERVFDATLNLERQPLDRRGLARHYGATLRVVALIYAHAVALKLKGVPWHRRPEVAA